MGGVNAHLALRSAPQSAVDAAAACVGCAGAMHRATLSTEKGQLPTLRSHFAQFLRERDVSLCGAAEAMSARQHMAQSCTIIAASAKEMARRLASSEDNTTGADKAVVCSHAHSGQRVAGLPLYPFKEGEIWFRRKVDDKLHPSVSVSRAVMRLPASLPLLRDHVVQGRVILPGVAYLELVRRAWSALSPQMPAVSGLEEVCWLAPSLPQDDVLEMALELSTQNPRKVLA
jgi:hypothetical protein